MEKFADKLENLFQEMFKVYKELRICLEQEKKHIVDMDVDSLWKISDRKKEFTSKIEQQRDKIFFLFEENNVQWNKEGKEFGLSKIINSLPFPPHIKSILKKAKVQLDIVKEELVSLVSENNRYVNESLSVIDGVFTTITSSDKKMQYNNAGMVLNSATQKYLIRAEV